VTEGDGGSALRWAQTCRQAEGEQGPPWPEPEAAALCRLTLAAPSGQDDGALEAAAHAFAIATGSMPLLARRLAALRQVVSAVATDKGLDPSPLGAALDRVTVAATQAALAELEGAALTDALTETGNRRALELAGRAALATAGRTGQPLSVMAIDLDGLKAINDTEGHAAGDRALAGMSAAVRAALRATDQLFRIGGDEFVVLLPLASQEVVAGLVGRMHLFNAPKFSWGAATTPHDGTQLETLLRVADARLYESRRASGYRRDTRAVGAPGAALRSPAHHWARAAVVAAVSMAAVVALAFVLGSGSGSPRPTDGTTPGGQTSTTVSPGTGHGAGGGSATTTTGAGSGGGSATTTTTTAVGGTGGQGGGSGGTGWGGSTTTTTTAPTTTTTTTTSIPITIPTLPKL
jgi:diguanylate cyclase (GGDEF)-like protein